jgi:hypothetical protein
MGAEFYKVEGYAYLYASLNGTLCGREPEAESS